MDGEGSDVVQTEPASQPASQSGPTSHVHRDEVTRRRAPEEGPPGMRAHALREGALVGGGERGMVDESVDARALNLMVT